MPTPTIIIGIGTSGLAALSNAQRYYQEATKEPVPEHVAMIFLETNENNNVGITYYENAITRVFLSLYQLDKMVNRLRETKASTNKWLPLASHVMAAGMGAGGVRSCGRLSLWGSNDHQDNFFQVIESIKNAFKKIHNINTEGSVTNKRPIVIITGSLVGGTGSGCFIDLAYLVKDILPNVERVFGLFLLPNTPHSLSGNEVKYANSYGALRDLNYMNEEGNRYIENWPNGKDVDIDAPPFDLAQFLSGDHKDGSEAIKPPDGVCRLIGLYLFLNILGGTVGKEYRNLYEKRMERLVDAEGNRLLGKFGTFGLSAIQFPKDQIEEFISCNLSEDLIRRWIDETNYVDNNHVTNILKDEIKANVSRDFNQMINKSFETLYIHGETNLVQELEQEAMKIAEKEIDDDEVQYIRRLFSSKSQGKFYSRVGNNLVSASNYLVEAIQKYIAARLNESENIEIARLSLVSFGDAILSCQQLWSSYEVNSDVQLWEKFLADEASRICKNKYGMVFEKPAVLKDRLMTLFNMMIMHFFTKELTKIRKCMENDSETYMTTINKVALPDLPFFERLKTKLAEMVKEDGLQTQADFNFEKRKKQILDDVNDTATTIRRVYPTSFDGECERAVKVYAQNLNREQPSKSDLKANSTGQDMNDLYAYFKAIDNDGFERKVYADMMQSYKASVSKHNCVADYNIVEYIRSHPMDAKSMAERAMRLLLASNDSTPPNAYLPKMIIGNDETDLKEIISIFRSQQVNYNEYEDKPDNKLAIPSLRNMIVFYYEKGGFNPIQNLPYVKVMEKTYQSKPSSIPADMSDDMWRSQRNAYQPS